MVLKATQKLCKNGSKNGLKTPSPANAARWLAEASFGHGGSHIKGNADIYKLWSPTSYEAPPLQESKQSFISGPPHPPKGTSNFQKSVYVYGIALPCGCLSLYKAKDWRELPRGKQVSHLCHNAHCVKAEHLVLESLWKNNNRKWCLNSTVCRRNLNGSNYLLEFKIYPK